MLHNMFGAILVLIIWGTVEMICRIVKADTRISDFSLRPRKPEQPINQFNSYRGSAAQRMIDYDNFYKGTTMSYKTLSAPIARIIDNEPDLEKSPEQQTLLTDIKEETDKVKKLNEELLAQLDRLQEDLDKNIKALNNLKDS